MKLFRRVYGLILPIVLLFSSGSAYAASKPSSPPTGITVSPAYVNVNILSGENQVPVYFSLTNNEPTVQTITLKTADFSSLNYTGGLLFVGSNATQLQKEYGLAKWLSLPVGSITLAPKQSTQVSVDINNRSDLAPGGHYGGLLFSVGSPTLVNAKNKVSVQPVASALMFVTKLDGATYKMGLAKVSTNSSFFSLPSQVTLLFYNNGNTQVTPRGFVTITNSSGKLISKGIINTDSGLILPGNSRYFQIPLQKLVSANGIGHYKLSVNFTFDGLNTYRQYQASLFLGAPMLIVAFIIVLVLLGLITYKLVKSRKTWIPLVENGLRKLKRPSVKPYVAPKVNGKLKPVPDSALKDSKKIEVKDSKGPKKLIVKDESGPTTKKTFSKAVTPKKKSVKVKISED